MNTKRALIFSVLWYAISFLIILAFQAIFSTSVFGLREYAWFWVLSIPLVLGLAKWYFKMDAPTTQKGFMLGVVALVVGLVLDVVIVGLITQNQGTAFGELFWQYYGDPLFYVTLVEILLLTTYAGFEFDATYTKDS